MLIQLKDGSWIDPYAVSVIAVYEVCESARPRVGICVGGYSVVVHCETDEDANATRDQIAAQVAEVVEVTRSPWSIPKPAPGPKRDPC